MSLATARTAVEASLSEAVRALPDAELTILARIATRLVGGLRTYGELKDRRGTVQWPQQRREEFWDYLVYFEVNEWREGR
jgi:hypothetical protein